MSSIYKKGRDGYYYYQRYVFNNKTGKNNKRIFHSLRTRDRLKAEKLKEQLDMDYLNENIKNTSSQETSLFRFKKSFIFVAVFSLIFLLYSNYIGSKNKITSSERINNSSIISSKDALPTSGLGTKLDHKVSVGDLSLKEVAAKNRIENVLSENDTISPSYLIARVEKLSEVFDQVKIYVTVNQDYGEKLLNNICKDVKVQFSDFSNIIICVYSHAGMGKDLAEGKQINASQKNLKTSWLAMYTYNSVEGEFFDYMPGSYLGLF